MLIGEIELLKLENKSLKERLNKPDDEKEMMEARANFEQVREEKIFSEGLFSEVKEAITSIRDEIV